MSNEIPFWKDVAIQRFKCPPGLSIKSVSIRELTVADDKEIEQNLNLFWPAKGKDKEPSMKAHLYEAVRRSIVEVDGKTVEFASPYMDMDKWTQKTVAFVIEAFSKVNGSVEDKDSKSFLESAETISLDRLGG